MTTMTLTIETNRTDTLSLPDFLKYVENDVDLKEPDGLVRAAPHFRELANNPGLVTGVFSDAIKRYLRGGPLTAYTPQSVIMGSGPGFFLRANIWTPLKLTSSFRSQEERVFSYRSAHNHNFSFMTIGYSGPGYETELYRYDSTGVEGYVGEEVRLDFVERTGLTPGKIMIYREKEDVHTQYPPEALSISLNLMVLSPRVNTLDQYFFDPETRRISSFPKDAKIFRRASVVAMAGWIADENTVDVFHDLVKRAPCRRVREAAVTAITRLACVPREEKQRLVEAAVEDSDERVRDCARKFLAS
jgi:hypothetical protein